LHYIAENIQIVHVFIAKGMEQKKEVDFEKWLKVMIFHCPFKILEKKLYEAVEVVITKFLSPNLAKGGAYVQYFLDIVLERDVRKPGRNSRFFEFWDKMQRNSASHHLKEITRFAL
jgi:hypothetical protein